MHECCITFSHTEKRVENTTHSAVFCTNFEVKAFIVIVNLLTYFASRPVSGLSLPEDVIKDAETAWSKVVATVTRVHPSNSLESQFFPLFAENVTGAQQLEGKKYFPNLQFYGSFF